MCLAGGIFTKLVSFGAEASNYLREYVGTVSKLWKKRSGRVDGFVVYEL